MLIHGDVTEQIIGAACEVWKVLGYGFLERVYQNALAEELRLRGGTFHPKLEIEVVYEGLVVGKYESDLVVEDAVLAELKSEREINVKHQAQVLNYLKATGFRVGILVNFGQNRCEWKRFVM